MMPEQNPAERIHQEKLFDSMCSKVAKCANETVVDGGGLWPALIVSKATQRLLAEHASEEDLPYRIPNVLADVVVSDCWGAFWFDEAGRKHLRLSSPEWREAQRKVSRPPSIVGPL